MVMISGGTLTRVMKKPLMNPHERAERNRERNRRREWKAQVLPAVAERDRAKPDDRTDRQIDAPGDDDESHRQGDQADFRHQPALVEQIVEGQKAVVEGAQDRERDDQDSRQQGLVAG